MASGAGLIGRIGVELYADMARFTGELGKADKQARDFVGGITGHFSKVQGAVVGLATTIGAVGFASMVNDVAKARAGLDDLADSGLGTVEALSRIKNSAKAFGGDFDGVTAAMSKMVNGLAGSEKETSKAGEALRRLGIDARDSSGALRAPAAIMEEVAVKFNEYRDGTDKAAYAQAMFGKGGEKLLPLLKDMAEQGAKVATVTAEQAAEADQYEKAMRALERAFEGSTKRIAGEFIPTATALADALTDVIKGSDGLKGSINDLAADGTIKGWAYDVGKGLAMVGDVGLGVARATELIAQAIKTTAFNLADLGKIGAGALMSMNGNFLQGNDLIRAGLKGLQKDSEDFEKTLNKVADRAWLSDKFAEKWAANAKKMRADAFDPNEGGAFNFGADKKRLDSTGFSDTPAAVAKVSEFAKAMEDANKRVAVAYAETVEPLDALTASEKKLAELRASSVWEEFTTKQRIKLRVTLEEAAGLEKVVAGQKEWGTTLAEASKFADEYRKKQDDEIRSVNGRASALVEEIANYGKLPSEIAAATLATQEFTLAQMKASEADEDAIIAQENLVKGYRNYVAALKSKEALGALSEQTRMLDQMGDVVGDIAGRFSEGWRSGTDAARQYLKRLEYDLLALAGKQFFLNLVANTTTGSIQQAATNGLANSVGGSIFGNVTGSLFSGGSLLASNGILNTLASGANSLGLTSVSQFLGGATGAIQGPGLSTAASLGGDVAGMLGQLGPYAAAAAAAYMLYQAFKDKGENWKGQLGFGSNAQAYTVDGVFGKEGFSTLQGTDSVNQQIRAFFGATGGIDKVLAKSLTGDQIAAIGGNLQSSRMREFAFPKNDGTAAEQLKFEYLSQKYAAVFDELNPRIATTIRAFKGTSDELLKMVASFAATQDFLASLNSKDLLGDIAKQIDASQNVIAAAIDRNNLALSAAAMAYDGTAASAEALTKATTEYYLAQVNLLAQIEQVKRSIDDMFGATFKNIQLAGLDKQGKYDFYQTDAADALAKALASNDVNAIQRYSSQINSDIQSAFGLLSPEEQAAQSAAFLARGREAQAAIDERIAQIQQDVADATKDQLETIRATLTESATAQQTAADTQTAAAAAQLAAANTPIQFLVDTGAGFQTGTFTR